MLIPLYPGVCCPSVASFFLYCNGGKRSKKNQKSKIKKFFMKKKISRGEKYGNAKFRKGEEARPFDRLSRRFLLEKEKEKEKKAIEG